MGNKKKALARMYDRMGMLRADLDQMPPGSGKHQVYSNELKEVKKRINKLQKSITESKKKK